MTNLGVLGSTNGTDLQPILDAIGAGKLDAKVSVVISNREDAYILERAKRHNTPSDKFILGEVIGRIGSDTQTSQQNEE